MLPFESNRTGTIPLQARVAGLGRRSRAAGDEFFHGMKFGAEGSLVFAPLIAYEIGAAQRGEVLPTAAARTAGLVTFPVMNGLAAGALKFLIPGMPAVGFIGGLLAFYPDSVIQDSIMRGVRTVTEAGRRLRRLETGQWYQDTILAQNQRQAAVMEMSGALGASRQYLGNEAALMHR